MTQKPKQVVILGAGQAGAQAAISLRQMGYDGDVTVVGDEPAPPYQRPPLSKGYLKGELDADRLFLKATDYFEQHNIAMRLGQSAVRIYTGSNIVELSSGDELSWDALVVATGTRPRRFDVPGRDLGGVLDLRTLEDVDRLKSLARAGAKAVIIGAGYIGLEAAAVLNTMGVKVTVLEAAPQVLGRVAGPEIGTFFTELHRSHGVSIRLEQKVEGFEGSGHVTGVKLADGEVIECDLALVGIGVMPNMEVAGAAGIACGNGILVDAMMRASHAGVYAIGDVAWRPLTHYGREGRLESVHNAIEGGKIAAAAIMGSAPPPMDVPWFWSDQYDVKLQTAGLWTGADKHVVRGDVEARKFAVFYLKEGKIIAVDAVNAAPEYIVGKKMVAAAARVASNELSDTSISMKDIGARALS